MKCIDEPHIFYGNYDSSSARVLYFWFKRCDPEVRKTCKNDTEFEK